MLSILKTEWLKIKNYPAFWAMVGIVMLTYPGINILFLYVYRDITQSKEAAGTIVKLLMGNPFAFPETWRTVAFFSSFFIVLPAMLVIMLITNEYHYKTHRQNIIDGWSRGQFITGKLLGVAIIAFVVMLAYIMVALGFGLYTNKVSVYRWYEQLEVIPLFFLQTFAQLSIAFLVGFLIKRAFIALGVFLFYNVIAENFLIGYLTYKNIPERRFLPMEVSDRILVRPTFAARFGVNAKTDFDTALSMVNQHVLLTILYTTVIWFLCYRLHAKKNI